MKIENFRSFLAKQLKNPSGWFGQMLLRFLNRKNAAMNDLVWQSAQLLKDDLILEIGFGGGDLIQKMITSGIPSLVEGIEMSPDALNFSKQRFRRLISQGKLKLQLGDAAALPFLDHRFHRVCTVNTLYFWPDPLQVLRECYRVLRPNGFLFIGYTSKTYLIEQNLTQYNFQAYEVEEVETLLKQAGFTQVSTVSAQNGKNLQFFCTSGKKTIM